MKKKSIYAGLFCLTIAGLLATTSCAKSANTGSVNSDITNPTNQHGGAQVYTTYTNKSIMPTVTNTSVVVTQAPPYIFLPTAPALFTMLLQFLMTYKRP